MRKRVIHLFLTVAFSILFGAAIRTIADAPKGSGVEVGGLHLAALIALTGIGLGILKLADGGDH